MIQDEYGKVVPITSEVVRSRGWGISSDSGLTICYRHPDIFHGYLARAAHGWVWMKPGQIIWDGMVIKYLHELIAVEKT